MSTVHTDFTNNVLVNVSKVTVTSSFGPRSYVNSAGVRVNDDHQGIDLVPIALVKTPEKARVKKVTFIASGGNWVELEHGGGFTTEYMHLASGATTCKVGEILNKGVAFTKVGGTGMVTGPHLHYVVRLHGVALDPLPFLQGKRALLPYEEIVMQRPLLPTLTVKVAELNYRLTPNGTRVNYLQPKEYPYIGKSQVINGYEWAEILLDDGSHVFCALNPAWNTIKLIEPTTVIVEKIVYKDFAGSFEQDGMLCTVSLKPLQK